MQQLRSYRLRKSWRLERVQKRARRMWLRLTAKWAPSSRNRRWCFQGNPLALRVCWKTVVGRPTLTGETNPHCVTFGGTFADAEWDWPGSCLRRSSGRHCVSNNEGKPNSRRRQDRARTWFAREKKRKLEDGSKLSSLHFRYTHPPTVVWRWAFLRKRNGGGKLYKASLVKIFNVSSKWVACSVQYKCI